MKSNYVTTPKNKQNEQNKRDKYNQHKSMTTYFMKISMHSAMFCYHICNIPHLAQLD